MIIAVQSVTRHIEAILSARLGKIHFPLSWQVSKLSNVTRCFAFYVKGSVIGFYKRPTTRMTHTIANRYFSDVNMQLCTSNR